jgi:hypothetical protein
LNRIRPSRARRARYRGNHERTKSEADPPPDLWGYVNEGDQVFPESANRPDPRDRIAGAIQSRKKGVKMNGKKIAAVVSLFVFVGLCFGAFFILEDRFCSNVRATAAERKIVENEAEIEEQGKKLDRQIIKDYRRQIRELEFEYGSPEQMPVKVRKYYYWLKDELARLMAEQQK